MASGITSCILTYKLYFVNSIDYFVYSNNFYLITGLVYILPKAIKRKTRRKSSNVLTENLLQFVSSSIKQSFVELYNIEWSRFWDVFLLKGLVGFAMGVYYSVYALYLKTQYDLSPKYVGYIISFQGVVGSFSSYFIGFINSFYNHDTDYSQRNFHLFLLMTVSLVGLILSFNVYVFTIWLIPLAVGNAMGRLITLEMVLKRSHGDHRGTLIGASNSVRSLSGVLAPMVAGFIGQFMGVSYVIYASLVATTMGVIMSYQINRKRLKVD